MQDTFTRRTFTASALALGAATASGGLALAANGRLYAYVGRQTEGFLGGPKGGGIDAFEVNLDDGSLKAIGSTGPEVDDLNSDGMCTSKDGRYLYCTNRTTAAGGIPGMGGTVSAFAINPADGTPRHLGTQLTMGAMPVGVAIDRTNSRVVVGNHGAVGRVCVVKKKNGKPVIERPTDSGTVTLYAVKEGALEPALDVAIYEESDPVASAGHGPANLGPMAFVQQGPACHHLAIHPGERWVIASDNGYDRIYVFHLDPKMRELKGKWFPAEKGKAPRHIAIHPTAPFFYVTNEREGSVSAFHFDATSGEAKLLETVLSVPASLYTAADGPPNPVRVSPCDIRMHPGGKFVYASNRGTGTPDTYAVFSIDAGTGKLTLVEVVETGGQGHREFNIEPSGRWLFGCNLRSGDVIAHAIDPSTGKLTLGARTAITRPAVIDFARG
jgi:6-phosphogluconolactonase